MKANLQRTFREERGASWPGLGPPANRFLESSGFDHQHGDRLEPHQEAVGTMAKMTQLVEGFFVKKQS